MRWTRRKIGALAGMVVAAVACTDVLVEDDANDTDTIGGKGGDDATSGSDASGGDITGDSPSDGGSSDGGGGGISPGLPDGSKPNFVVFYGEARGWTSLSVLQDEEQPDSRSEHFLTPNLEGVAAEGMTFADFYAPSPRCMPSRASYLTGKSPARLHMTFIPEGNKDGSTDSTATVVPPTTVTTLPTQETTIGSLLKGAGYATAHFGKWHAGNVSPAQYGFDESDGATSNKGPDGTMHPNPTEAFGTADRGIDFISRQVAAGKPFYLQISHYGGTDEANARPETLAEEQERLADADPRLWPDAAVIRDMDDSVGLVLAKLKELGVEGTTYVIFTADHGRQGTNANLPLNQGKGTVWEGGIRVPLIVRGPGVGRGAHSHIRASQVDLLPTLAELAGVPGSVPKSVEGGSLSGVLGSGTGAVQRADDAFVVHFPHYDKDPLGPASTIILGDYKLIHFYADDSWRLYDLVADIGEKTDLAARMPDKVAELKTRLETYLTEVGAQMPTVK